MNIRSCKAKGRRLCQEIKEMIHRAAPELEDGDVRVNPASCPGEDIWLSPRAKKALPLAIEAKNQETAKPWDWINQAEKYGKDGRCPVVVFSRNRAPQPYAIISLRDLLFLVADQAPITHPETVAYNGDIPGVCD